jgi:maleylacetoacetate isomerase
MSITLYSYWRSSAAYRVRIALNLKKLPYKTVSVSLAPGIAEHRADEYRSINPQMLVPFLQDGELGIAQSMTILEYLEEHYPETPLLPKNEPLRTQVRSYCNLIACDIHPLNNLRVQQYLKNELGADTKAGHEWYVHWIHEGFAALEELTGNGPYVFSDSPTLADALLVPQIYNARRFEVPLSSFPKLVRVADACNDLPAFKKAAPELQPDAA